MPDLWASFHPVRSDPVPSGELPDLPGAGRRNGYKLSCAMGIYRNCCWLCISGGWADHDLYNGDHTETEYH